MTPIARAKANSDTMTGSNDVSGDRSKFSISMYYAFYYQPLFCWPYSREKKSEIVLLYKMERWVQILDSTTRSDDSHFPQELSAIRDLAKSRDQFVWAMIILVASVNSYLPESTDLVLRTALNIRYNPTCILAPYSVPGQQRELIDLPTAVTTFFKEKAPEEKLNRPRFEVDSIIGRRLAEDVIIMTKLAHSSGLKLPKFQVTDFLDSVDRKSDFTLALIGLLSQSPPWKIRVLGYATEMWHWPRGMVFFGKCCCVQIINFSLHENNMIFTKATVLYKITHTTDKGARLHQ